MRMIPRRTVLALPMLAAACGSEPPPPVFNPPDYAYLNKLRLNVATIEIEDRSAPEPGSVDGLAPVRLTEALKQMANDRLVAGGSAGRAVFVIDRASIVRVQGGLSGAASVHLDIFVGGGDTRAGYAEAKVARQRSSTDTDERIDAVLYQFVNQMMADMNVEFEFQVTHALKDYLQATSATAPTPAPVQSQDLAAPTRRP